MPMTFAEWSTLVRHHDLTFAYSDDNSVWRRGQAVYDLILAEAVNFPRPDVERVWNEMVDSFLIPEARAPFYWRWDIWPPGVACTPPAPQGALQGVSPSDTASGKE